MRVIAFAVLLLAWDANAYRLPHRSWKSEEGGESVGNAKSVGDGSVEGANDAADEVLGTVMKERPKAEGTSLKETENISTEDRKKWLTQAIKDKQQEIQWRQKIINNAQAAINKENALPEVLPGLKLQLEINKDKKQKLLKKVDFLKKKLKDLQKDF